VTRRKIGHEVTCPKCSAPVTVPAGEGALSGVAKGSSLPPELGRLGVGDLVNFDDLPELMVDGPRAGAAQPLRLTSANAPTVANGVSVTRTSIYLQAVLLLLIAGVAFGLGYWFGGVDAQHKSESSPATEAG
jgi:hypothetical protein